MNKIIRFIIKNYWIHQFVIKLYIITSTPFIIISAFLRKQNIINNKNIYKLKSYENIHNNQRCFIIGNGPSLTAKDLDNLKNEITFAFNRIFLIFDKTKWRPTYYMLADQSIYMDAGDEIDNKDLDIKFVGSNCKKYGRKIKDAIYFYTKLPYDSDKPKFISDAIKYFYDGYTVTYFAMQLAIYMGFKEIYLLGVDCSYAQQLGKDGKIEVNDNGRSYFAKQYSKNQNLANTYKMIMAYKKAREFADKNDVKIYNVTRGGKLEEFERISFDELDLPE